MKIISVISFLLCQLFSFLQLRLYIVALGPKHDEKVKSIAYKFLGLIPFGTSIPHISKKGQIQKNEFVLYCGR
jgi:hypothetical protein